MPEPVAWAIGIDPGRRAEVVEERLAGLGPHARCGGRSILLVRAGHRSGAVDGGPDVVVVELGTNDSDAPTFREHLVETLETCRACPSSCGRPRGPGGRDDDPGRERRDPRRWPPTRTSRSRTGRRSCRRRPCRPTASIPTRTSCTSRPTCSPRCCGSGAPRSRGTVRRPAAEGWSERPPECLRHERAGRAGIRRLVCIVLGPPDLTWPGGLSMPPAARLARGFCSPRSYLSIALRTYTRGTRLRKRAATSRTRPDVRGGRRAAPRSAASVASPTRLPAR